MADFYGKLAGLDRIDCSRSSNTTVELGYFREGADMFRPMDEAVISFAVEVGFGTDSMRTINSLPVGLIDDLILQLKAAKQQYIDLMHDGDTVREIEANAKAYRQMVIERALADKRAEFNQLNAGLNEILSSRTLNGRKLGVKKALDMATAITNEINEVKGEIATFEAELNRA